MRTHSRTTWPLFAAVTVLVLLGMFVFDSTAAAMLLLGAWVGLLGTCIYALAGEDVQDGCGGIAGGTGF